MTAETCAYMHGGYGDTPPEWCHEDPEEGSDYCAYHGPNAGPDPDDKYDNGYPDEELDDDYGYPGHGWNPRFL